MSLAPDRGLQFRIAGALALVVFVNGLLLSVLAWSLFRVLSASTAAPSVDLGLPVTVGALLLGAVGLVVVQARYGSRTVVAGLDLETVVDDGDGVGDDRGGVSDDRGGVSDDDGDGPRTVTGRIRRLATQADVPVPSVAVADHPEPGCLTVGPQRSPTIVVTTGLIDRLADDELDAALAHEVAHVANRDLPVVTAVAASVAIGDRLLERERRLRYLLSVSLTLALFTGIGLLVFAIPILILGAISLVVSAIARAMLGVNAIALGLFARAREYAADRGACQLTGDPAALAGALERLEDRRPTRDKRLHASATLGIVPVPFELAVEADGEREEHWIDPWLPDRSLFEGADGLDGGRPIGFGARVGVRVGTWIRERCVVPVTSRVRRVLAWRPATHPPTADRVDRLRAMVRG